MNMPNRNHSAAGTSGHINTNIRGKMSCVDLDWLAACGNRAQRRWARQELARQQRAATPTKGGRHA